MNEEIILKIEEFKEDKESQWDNNEGWRITTDKQVIEIGMCAYNDCCASHGYFFTPDDVKDFIGAKLLAVQKTDTALKKEKMEEIELDAGGVMFIDFETDKGVLQFTAYNSHNGYYGNTAYIKSNQLTDEDTL